MLSEFELISRFFTRAPRSGGALRLGVGDDCALLAAPAAEILAVSTDMLVEGRHFFAGAEPEALGHKALAVNLSDLAAMGARPLGFSLALALPAANEDWLEKFSRGLFALADLHQMDLIGGDTTRGPLNLCITIFGSVPESAALRRTGAKAGDEIWVSGTLGDARLALEALQGKLTLTAYQLSIAAQRLHRPTPRIALGLALRGIASAAIDVSDGLLGDLGHVLDASGTGAVIQADALPLGAALRTQSKTMQYEFALNGGDDYELCFTAPVHQHAAVLAAGLTADVALTCIGHIRAEAGLHITDASGQPLAISSHSFDHFARP